MSAPTPEFGIEHDVPGLPRRVYASNFRSREQAELYVQQRIASIHRPSIMTRMSIPSHRALDVVPLSKWVPACAECGNPALPVETDTLGGAPICSTCLADYLGDAR